MNQTEAPVEHDTGNGKDEEDAYSFGQSACIIGIIAAAVLLLSLLGAQYFLALDILTHFALQYMIAGAAFWAAFFLPRWNIAAAVALIFVGYLVTGWVAKSPGKVPEKTPQTVQGAVNKTKNLKVMTFNTWVKKSNWKAVAASIEAQNPDIVALLEFTPRKSELLEHLKAKYPYQVTCIKVRACHMALLSRFKIAGQQARTRWAGPPYLHVHLGGELAGVEVFAVHTIRPPHFRAHMKQILYLSDAVNKSRGSKIVMGDFNATPFSRTLTTFKDRTRLTRLTSRPSWPAEIFGIPEKLAMPLVAIDHIFVSPDIKLVRGAQLGSSAGSDHFPVDAVVSVPIKQ